ncbi:MAG TPA: CDP-alcohol phosphatidyltransferase family protein, partial [Candidatus Nanoarchaeia archaeon]|nr:CDP-alcohol phosphatidyltransferase family protein [Candidatus Nanoarchaeia archaeon]
MRKVPSVRELQEICFRSPPDVYRKISIYFTRTALMFGVRANHITCLRAIFLVLGIVIFLAAPITLAWLIAGLLALHLVLFLDTMDGAIARYNKESSFFGEMLDFILDHASSTIIYFLVAGVLCVRLFEAWPLFFVSLATVLLAQFAAFVRALYAEYHVPTDEFKQQNVALFFFHQDNMRLLLLALTLATIAHLFTAHALPVLVLAYVQFMIIKILFLVGFLWRYARQFPLTRHFLTAYLLSFAYVLFRTRTIKERIQRKYPH